MSEANSNNTNNSRQFQQGGGAGRGGRGQGGRGRGCGRGGRGNHANNNKNKKPKFEGDCKELGTHVYVYGGQQAADVFTKTTDKIKIYIQSNMKDGQDIVDAIKALDHTDMDALKPKKSST